MLASPWLLIKPSQSLCIGASDVPSVDARADFTVRCRWILWGFGMALHAFAAVVCPNMGVLTKVDRIEIPGMLREQEVIVLAVILNASLLMWVLLAIVSEVNHFGVVIALFKAARCELLLREAVTIIAMIVGAAVMDAANLVLPIKLFIEQAMELITAHPHWFIVACVPRRNLEINIKVLCATLFFNASGFAAALLHMILAATVVCVDVRAIHITVEVTVSKEVFALVVPAFMAVCVIKPHFSIFAASGF